MKKLTYTIIALSLAVTSFAASSLSMEEAFSLALKNNFSIQQIKNNTEILEKSATPGNAGLLPSVSANAGVNYADNTISGTNTQTTTTSATINASYKIFDGLGNVYTYQKLKSQSEQAMVNEQDAIENTLLLVAQSFLTTSLAKDNMYAAKDQLDITQEDYDRLENNYNTGNTNKLYLLNSQVNLNMDEVSYLNAEQSYEEQKRALNVLLGFDPSTEYDIVSYSAGFNPYDLNTVREEAFANNTSLQSTEMSLEQSQLDLKSSNSAFWPTISLSGSYGYNQTETDMIVSMSDPNAAFSAGINLGWDLFTGRKNTQKQISKISVENSEIALEAEKLDLLENVQNLYSAYENSLVIFDKQIQNLEASQLNFDQVKEYYEQGQVNTTLFREAQLNLTTAKISISQAKNSAYMYGFQIMRLSGKLLENL